MFHQNNWDTDEIQKLKISFLQGKRIKEIARELDRTPTALNKALTRFGIRQKGTSKRTRALNWQEASKGLLSKSNLIKLRSNAQVNISEESSWVTMKAVKEYLEEQGFTIKVIHHDGDNADDNRYMTGHRIYSPLQLILKANRLRSDQNHHSFLVEGVTW